MRANVSASTGGYVNRSRRKIQNWNKVHDRRAITIVAGRGFFKPDPTASAKRAAEQLSRRWRCA